MQNAELNKSLKHYNKIIKKIDRLIDEMESGTSIYIAPKFLGLDKWLFQSINISEINKFPEEFIIIRDKIALQIKELAAIIYHDYNCLEASLGLIDLASQINVEEEARIEIEKNFDALRRIATRRNISVNSIDINPSLYILSGIGRKIYIDTVYFVVFYIPIFPIARYALDNDGYSYKFFRKLKLRLWQKLWIYGLLTGIVYFIFSSLYESNQSSIRNEYFEIGKNGFAKSFPLDKEFVAIRKTPYVKKRTLPVDMNAGKVDEIYDEILHDVRADSAKEIKSIIQIWRGAKKVGEYTDGSDALQNYCFIKIIDIDSKTETYEDTIFGSFPFKTKQGRGSASGTSVNYNLRDFINKSLSERPVSSQIK